MNPEQSAPEVVSGAVPFFVREMREDEVAFVVSSWLRSYEDSPWAKKIGQADYYEGHGRIVKDAMARSTVLVAEHKNEPGLLLGFACGERTEHVTCIHYCYVKSDYRTRMKKIGHARTATVEMMLAPAMHSRYLSAVESGRSDEASGMLKREYWVGPGSELHFAHRLGVATSLVESLLKRIGGKRVVCSHTKHPTSIAMGRRGFAFSPYPLFKVTSTRR